VAGAVPPWSVSRRRPFHVPDLTGGRNAAVPTTSTYKLVEGGRTVADRNCHQTKRLRPTCGSPIAPAADPARPDRPDVSLPVLIAVFGISMAALLARWS